MKCLFCGKEMEADQHRCKVFRTGEDAKPDKTEHKQQLSERVSFDNEGLSRLDD